MTHALKLTPQHNTCTMKTHTERERESYTFCRRTQKHKSRMRVRTWLRSGNQRSHNHVHTAKHHKNSERGAQTTNKMEGKGLKARKHTTGKTYTHKERNEEERERKETKAREIRYISRVRERALKRGIGETKTRRSETRVRFADVDQVGEGGLLGAIFDHMGLLQGSLLHILVQVTVLHHLVDTAKKLHKNRRRDASSICTTTTGMRKIIDTVPPGSCTAPASTRSDRIGHLGHRSTTSCDLLSAPTYFSGPQRIHTHTHTHTHVFHVHSCTPHNTRKGGPEQEYR